LRDVEIALIRKAVADARGNVVEAAKALGISRATVYRKLGKK
jgi:sigma-54 dependent transcriptional regulator, acetoin dehydrogenase operon transcriptional activator AcoR